MARKLAGLVYVSDIVRARKERGMTRGVTGEAVRRWLRRLDARSHGRVLINRKPYVTTLSLLRKADPRWLEENEIAKDDVRELKSRLHALDRRVGAQGARLRELQQVVEALASRQYHDLVAALDERSLAITKKE